MIKPLDVSPLNTSHKIHYECKSCGAKGVFVLTNSINTDNDGDIVKNEVFECPKCNNQL